MIYLNILLKNEKKFFLQKFQLIIIIEVFI